MVSRSRFFLWIRLIDSCTSKKTNKRVKNACQQGFTNVTDENLFGINSATLPDIKVGHRNKIAAGMVLDRSIGDDTTMFYRYKERIIALKDNDKK